MDLEYIREQHAEKGGLLYVNVYAVSRHYGGPEEGGWWYNAGEPLESVSFETVAEAAKAAEALTKKWADYAHGDIYSVLGGEEVTVCIEDHFARHWPERKPQYS